MATVVIMPKLGLTMTEGSIEKWLKQEGDRVEKGEPLVEIITEKLNFQYEAPASASFGKSFNRKGKPFPYRLPLPSLLKRGRPSKRASPFNSFLLEKFLNPTLS